MIFLHESVKSNYFKDNKKLNLLNKGIITIGQFVNLIDETDEFLMIGPAIVAKSAIEQFLLEWKMHQLNVDATVASRKERSQNEIIIVIERLLNVFPELTNIFNEMNEQIKISTCQRCVKTRYIGILVERIKDLKDDGRLLYDFQEDVDSLMWQFYPDPNMPSLAETFSEYDIEWMKPERLVGLGHDLIDNLDNCFECTIKHIGRAKILYEEFLTGYPNHGKMMFNELEKGNAALEDAYLIYLDSMSQLDMASCELVGNITNLPNGFETDIINLANKIRSARILFQEDVTKVPNFDSLRIDVKKLQIDVNNHLNKNMDKNNK